MIKGDIPDIRTGDVTIKTGDMVDNGDRNSHDFGIRVGFVYLCVLRYFKVAKSHLI